MKKKTTLFLLLSLFIFNPSFGQKSEPELKIYPEQKKSSRENIKGVVGQDDGGYYILKTKRLGITLIIVPIGAKQKMVLEYYDKNLKLKSSIPLKGIHKKTSLSVKKSFEFFAQDGRQNLYLFYSQKIENRTVLYKSKLDKNSLVFSNPEIISQLKNINNRSRQASYRLLTSQNGLKKAVVSIVEAEDLDNSIVNIDYLNSDLEKISTLEEIVPYKEEDIAIKNEYYDQQVGNKNISDILLTNSGDVVAIARVDVDGSFLKVNYEYNLVGFSENQRQAQITKINIGSKSILSATLAASRDSSNNIQCYGFYNSRPDRPDNIKGSFSLLVNAEDLIVAKEKFNDFNKEDVLDFLIPEDRNTKGNKKLKERLDKGKDPRNMNYYLRDINYLNDGSYTVMAEYFYRDHQISSNPNGGTTTTIIYSCMNMVFLHYNKNGKLEWVENIYKNQFNTGNRGYQNLGTFHFQLDNKIYLLYPTAEEKETLVTVIDKRGRIETNAVATYGRKTKLGKYHLRPSTFQLVGPNDAIGFGFRREGKYKALRLSL